MLDTQLGEFDPSEGRVSEDLASALSGLAASFGGEGRERQYLSTYKYAPETQRRRGYVRQNVGVVSIGLASGSVVLQAYTQMFGAPVNGLCPSRFIDNNATTVADLLGQYKGTPSTPKSIDAIRFKWGSYLVADTASPNIIPYDTIKAFYDGLILSQASVLLYPNGNAEPPWRGLRLADMACPLFAGPDEGWIDLPGAIDWSGIQAWMQVGLDSQGTGENGTGVLIDPSIPPAGVSNVAFVAAGAFEFRVLPDGYPAT